MAQNFRCEIAAGVRARKIGEETVLLSLQEGAYYSLNAVGSYIWELLASGADFLEIVDAIASKFQIPRGLADTDAQELLQDLELRCLIRRLM